MASLLVIQLHVILALLPLYHAFIMEEGHGTLMSNKIGATCEDYRIINCETGQTPSFSETTYITEYTSQSCSSNQCATTESSSYMNDSPLPVFKQVGHIDNEGDRFFFIKLKWNLLPGVQHYTILFKFTSDDGSIVEGSTDYSCNDFQNLANCKSYQVSNVTDEVDFSSVFGSTINQNYVSQYKKLMLKVIAYPVYEWPLLVVDTPNRCITTNGGANTDWYGCKKCHKCANDDELPPQNFTAVQFETENGELLTNISWTPQSSALQYYLHINTSEGEQLYTVDKQRSHVTLTAGTLAGTAWLESFSCSCSSPTDILNIPGNAILISSPSAASHRSTIASYTVTSHPLIPPTSSASISTHSSTTILVTNTVTLATDTRVLSTSLPATPLPSATPSSLTTPSRPATPSQPTTPSPSSLSLSTLQSYTLSIAIMVTIAIFISIIALLMSIATFVIVVRHIRGKSTSMPKSSPKNHATNRTPRPRSIPLVIGKAQAVSDSKVQRVVRYELASTPSDPANSTLVYSP